jgi:hypothetical protein
MFKPASVLRTSTLVSPEGISFGHARRKAKQLAFNENLRFSIYVQAFGGPMDFAYGFVRML